MKKSITCLALLSVLFSCTKTETEEIETIVEVPVEIEATEVSLMASSLTALEGDEDTITITATLESALAVDASIELNFSGSAVFDEDYVVSSSMINFEAGSTTGTVDLTVISDNTFESGVENIVVSLAGLSNSVTVDGNSVVQIDVTDGSAIVSFEETIIEIEENYYYAVNVMLSNALNEDIVVYFEAESDNTSFGFYNYNYVIIPAGSIEGYIYLSLNDYTITTAEEKDFNLTISAVENDDVVVGTNSVMAISTTEVSEGFRIDAAWETESDLFELRVFDATRTQVASSSNSGNSESIYISDYYVLEDGTYTIELQDYYYDGVSSEVVTFDFLDEEGNTYGGSYTFTVNTDEDYIPVFTLDVVGGVYSVTQTSTSN